MGRYASRVDLHVILRDECGRILLGERRDTGFADGQLGLPSGHLEDGESATAGAVREVDEELGVQVEPGHLRFVHSMHHYTDSGRVALLFETTEWSGAITNREPQKCAGWSFYDPAALPGTVVDYVADALRHIGGGTAYSERGWFPA